MEDLVLGREPGGLRKVQGRGGRSIGQGTQAGPAEAQFCSQRGVGTMGKKGCDSDPGWGSQIPQPGWLKRVVIESSVVMGGPSSPLGAGQVGRCYGHPGCLSKHTAPLTKALE